MPPDFVARDVVTTPHRSSADSGEVLDERLLAALRAVAGTPRLLVCSDFDGTLAPIVEDPAAARTSPENAAAIRELVALPETVTAVVSGRALHDLRELAALPAEVRLVGSHGAEYGAPLAETLAPGQERLRARVSDIARGLADGVPGVLLEEKPAGVAVHVRRASRADAARVLAAVDASLRSVAGVRLTAGHEVLEASVADGDKGSALAALRREYGATAVVFVGDDVTDEHAFARLEEGDVGVKVGPGESAARHRVADPAQVAALLTRLAAYRRSKPRGSP